MKRMIALLAAVWMMLGFACLHDATAEELPMAQATVSVRRGDLNGREKPDVHSQKVAWFQDGDVIDIYEIRGDWALTEGGEAGTCWVHLNYLVTEDGGTYTVIANGRLRIRSTPDGAVTGYATPGQTVDVLAIFGDWARTESGWLMIQDGDKIYLERKEG